MASSNSGGNDNRGADDQRRSDATSEQNGNIAITAVEGHEERRRGTLSAADAGDTVLGRSTESRPTCLYPTNPVSLSPLPPLPPLNCTNRGRGHGSIGTTFNSGRDATKEPMDHPEFELDLSFVRLGLGGNFEYTQPRACCSPSGEELVNYEPPPEMPLVTIDTTGTEGNPEARERGAQSWIEIVTGKQFHEFSSNEFARNVKDGERLCSLINAISPGAIPEVHDKTLLGYEQIENIRNFVVACRAFGVPSHKLVDVTCVHEMTDTPHVVECVHALGSAVQSCCPRFRGPHLGNRRQGATARTPFSFVTELDSEMLHTMRHEEEELSPTKVKGGNDTQGLVLNMQDVERPRPLGRTFTTSVGSVNDLRPPTPLSARAKSLCPTELVSSPRALVVNTDPIGHPPRSATIEAVVTPSSATAATSGSMGGVVRGAWGTGSYRFNHSPKTTTPSKRPSTTPFNRRMFSPVEEGRTEARVKAKRSAGIVGGVPTSNAENSKNVQRPNGEFRDRMMEHYHNRGGEVSPRKKGGGKRTTATTTAEDSAPKTPAEEKG